MARRLARHLYRDGAKGAELRKFEREYGHRKGRRVYGAVVGKVRRERAAKRRRAEMAAHSHSHGHGRGHHRGYCGPLDRKGHASHSHRARRVRRHPSRRRY